MVQYYLFAAFIFVLVCLALVVWRILFGGFKNERERLEAKRKELTEALESVKKEADNFYHMASEKLNEITAERNCLSVSGYAPNSVAAANFAPEPATYAVETELSISDSTESVKPPLIESFRKAIEEASVKHNGITPIDGDAPEVSPVSFVGQVAPSAPVGQVAGADAMAPLNTISAFLAAIPSSGSKRDRIMAMINTGMTPVQAAKELGITRNEVDLIIKTGKRVETPFAAV